MPAKRLSSQSLRVLHVLSEMVPLVKTGGLADVGGALPAGLRGHGHDARVVIPGYRSAIAAAADYNLKWLAGAMTIEAGGVEHQVGVGCCTVDTVTVYLLACNELFDRDGIYGPAPGVDFDDNARRYSVFSKAALALCQFIEWTPHIVHAHDWQAGLVPVLLQRGFLNDLPATRSVFTIHNIAYQGAMWHFDMKLTGLDWSLFNPMHLEHHGKLNLLKAGIVFADRVTTVSRRYAGEIQTEEFGYGLHQIIAGHKYKLSGITNGIDANIWNPATDPYLPAHFNKRSLQGKVTCKDALRQEVGLAPRSKEVAVVGCISRLVEQKGLDLVVEAVSPYIMDGRMQLVLAVLAKVRYSMVSVYLTVLIKASIILMGLILLAYQRVNAPPFALSISALFFKVFISYQSFLF